MAGQILASPELLDYVRDVSLRDDDILRGLRDEIAGLPAAKAMQAMPEQAQLLGLLIRIMDAKAVLEIGTFTGYSTLCMARALPADGRLVTCDVTERWSRIGSPYWERAGVAERIEFRLGDAVRTIAGLLVDPGPESFDIVFIDADKANQLRYYEDALVLIRPGGLIVIDNTLFFGRVVDPAAQDPDTIAVRDVNALVRDDDRVDICMLTMADGITLARKRPHGR